MSSSTRRTTRRSRAVAPDGPSTVAEPDAEQLVDSLLAQPTPFERLLTGAPDRPLGLATAGKVAPGKCSASSVHRFITRGVQRADGVVVRLAHSRVGRRLFVTPRQLDEFFHACGAVSDGARDPEVQS